MALQYPTYGYQVIHQELHEEGIRIGLHTTRRILKALNLNLKPVKKKRLRAPKLTPEVAYPEGRKVQIDVTQVKLQHSRAWVYIVQDVTESGGVGYSRGATSV